MWDIVQMIGAVLLLAAFLAVQFDRISERALSYLVINAIGSGLLGITAVVTGNWGFVLLEGVWTLVSAAGIGIWLARRRAGAGRPTR